MSLQSPALPPAEPQSQRQAQVFEFTKRKKWADILLSELPDTVILILDIDGQIQYVGSNTNDVLGWEIEDLPETDVLDIVNDNDKISFSDQFQRSIGSRQGLSCYTRLKCKPGSKSGPEQGMGQRELLFEIRGHALYLPNDNECKCFFLVAKPYPSRNMASLNTFLELKIENERLTQRLRDLKAQQDAMPGAINDLSLQIPRSAIPHAPYATFEFPSSRDGTAQSPSTSSTSGSFSTMQAAFTKSTVPGTNPRDEEGGEEGKKKKQKKSNGQVQQYVCVTCGRTDSPEWRKGPRGPKTLCNACGLRWAKRSKRTDDVPIPYVHEQGSRGGQGGLRQPQTSSSGSNRGGRGVPVAHAALSVTPIEPPLATVSIQQQQQQQNQNPSQQGQGRYIPTPSPTHAAFPQAQMSALPPTPTSGHYSVHPLTSGFAQHHGVQPSPTPVAQGYMRGQAPSQEQYQAAYDHYQWAMNQHGEGGYQY